MERSTPPEITITNSDRVRKHKLSKLAAKGLLALAILSANSVTTTVAQESAPSKESSKSKAESILDTHNSDDAGAVDQPAHYLEIGAQEDGLDSNRANADAILSNSYEMGARWWRVILRPDKLEEPNGWEPYDFEITKAREYGFNVHITIGINKSVGTAKAIGSYVTSIVNHYGEDVYRYSLGNEVNAEGIEPEDYRLLYELGENIISKKVSDAEVIAFDLSSKDYPLVYFRRASQTCIVRQKKTLKIEEEPKKSDTCLRMEMFRLGYHPYLFTKSPTPTDYLPEWDAEQIGINALKVIEGEVSRAFDSGWISTPKGLLPKLDLNEFAYLHEDSDGRLENRDIPEEVRRSRYPQSLNVTCKNLRVARISIYGVGDQGEGWPGNWRSHIFEEDGTPLGFPSGPYFRIKKWTNRPHEDCILEK